MKSTENNRTCKPNGALIHFESYEVKYADYLHDLIL